MARPKDRTGDGRGRSDRARGDDDALPSHPSHPSHRATRLLALGALILVVAGYGVLYGCQRKDADRSVEAYCRQIESTTSLDDALGNLDGKAAAIALTQLEQVDDVAPIDIEPDVRTVLEASRPLVETLGTTSPDQEHAVREVLQAHQSDMQRVDTAARAVTTYTATNCHRDLATTIPSTIPSSLASTSTTAFAPVKPSTSSTRKPVAPTRSTPG